MLNLLWLHGFPLSSAIFDEQLAIEGVRHVVPDLPGFGGAPPSEDELTMEDYARMAIEELDRLGIEKAVFAGVSMGGYICFAAYRLAPERFSGLILIDTRETADDGEARKGRYDSIAKVRAEGVTPIVEAMLPKMLTPAASDVTRERVRTIMASASPAGVITALSAMAGRSDSSSLLTAIDVPTLIIVGEEDPITPPKDAERMAASLRDVTLVKIPGAAHLSNVEKPEEFNGAVETFLARLRLM
jgi:3-oxoadipate enol-lactonase